MANKTISNPGGLFGLTADVDGQIVMWGVNNSGATRQQGDLVVVDVTGTNFTTTTTVNDKTVVGVVAAKDPSDLTDRGDTYAAGTTMPVIILGPARINIAANVVAANDILTSSAAAGVAATNAGAPAANAVSKSLIAVALEASAAKSANNTIRCWVSKS